MFRIYNKDMRSLLFVICLGAFALYFPAEEKKAGGKSFKLKLDEKIPLIPIFVIPYVLFFPYVFGLLIGAFVAELPGFEKFATALIFVSLTTTLIYMILPSEVVKPYLKKTGELIKIVNFIRKVDNPENVFPSNHVAYSIVASIYLTTIFPQFWLLVWLVFALISISTIFIKQHYIIDIPAGLVVGVLAWLAAGIWF